MKASNQLFKLIKSLDKHEKRYFHLFASSHREASSYILLFDFMNKQSTYDEAVVKTHFRSHPFIKQFPVTKNLLQKAILRSMNLYRTDHSMDAILREMLASIDFLFEKTFYKECWKIIQRAKNIALTYEKFIPLLEILKWEKRLIANQSRLTKQDIKKIFMLEKEALKKIENAGEFLLLHKLIAYETARTVHVKNKKESAQLHIIMSSPLHKNIEFALSFNAKTYFYQNWALYYRFTGNEKKSYEFRKLLNKHWESYPHYIEEYPLSYISVLQNLVNAQLDLKKYTEFSQTVEKFKAIKTRSGAVEQLIFLAYQPVKIVFHNNTLLPKNNYMISEAEENFHYFEGKIEPAHTIMFYYMFSWYYFNVGDYKRSLHWINKILNQSSTDVRMDLHCFARIFNIMIHFELGNTELLEYLCKSAQRFLEKNKRYNKFEEIIIVFFKKLSAVSNEPEKIKEQYRELKKDLQAIAQKLFEKSSFGYFNFFAWIDSKIEKKLLADIIRTESKTYYKD